jgi:hypothetical protein
MQLHKRYILFFAVLATFLTARGDSHAGIITEKHTIMGCKLPFYPIFTPPISMLKITDTDYFLPKIEALQGIKTLGSGTTEPMLIGGVCTTTGTKAEYVVKYRNSPRMSVQSSCRELIAAFIARELDLNVTEPALVNVSPQFVETLVGMDGYKHASNSTGLNFGCKYIEGCFEFLTNQKLNDAQYEQAERIFALDIFISNVDRRRDKQNMLTDGEKVIVFDHELAFSFVMDIIKNPTPWIIGDPDKTWIKNHFFYPVLRENEHNFDNFVESFAILDEKFWGKAINFLPKEWVTEQVNQIKGNLQTLIKNKTTFLNELYKVLK